MDLIADRGRRVAIEELNTSRLLAHARKQAVDRKLDDILIADVDSHHYENECYDEFLPFIENEVLRQLVLAGRAKGRQTLMPSQVAFQDMGGRVTRYPLRSTEKTEKGKSRDIELGHRWMDNRWLTEKALPESGGRLYSMLCLPLSDPDEALRQVETFGDRKHVTGFLVTSAPTMPVNHNSCMKVYSEIEER